MPGIDLYPIQQEITEFVKAQVPWRVETGGVPDATSVPYVDGVLAPYVILRFTEGMPGSNGNSFGGPTRDEMYAYVDALCVADDDEVARKLATFVNSKLLGRKFTNASALRKNFGGGIFAITSGDRNPAAYVAVLPFRFEYNLDDVGSTTY